MHTAAWKRTEGEIAFHIGKHRLEGILRVEFVGERLRQNHEVLAFDHDAHFLVIVEQHRIVVDGIFRSLQIVATAEIERQCARNQRVFLVDVVKRVLHFAGAKRQLKRPVFGVLYVDICCGAGKITHNFINSAFAKLAKFSLMSKSDFRTSASKFSYPAQLSPSENAKRHGTPPRSVE